MARPPNSWVWEHFRQDTSKDPNPAYTSVLCQVCNKTLRYSSRNGPTNLSRHLTRSHHMNPPDFNITRRPFEPVPTKPTESTTETNKQTCHNSCTNSTSDHKANNNLDVAADISNVSNINSNKITVNRTIANNNNVNNTINNGTVDANTKNDSMNGSNNPKLGINNTLLNDRILNNPINTLIPNFSPARFSQYKQNSEELLFQTPSRVNNIRRVRSHSRSLSSDMLLPQTSYLSMSEINLNPLFPETIKSSNRTEYDQFLKNVNLLPVYRMDIGKKNSDSSLQHKKTSKNSRNVESISTEKDVSPLLPSQSFSGEVKINKQLTGQQSQLLSTGLTTTHTDIPQKNFYSMNNQYNNNQQQQQQQQPYTNDVNSKALNSDEKKNEPQLQITDSNRPSNNGTSVIGLSLPNISDIGDFSNIPNVLTGMPLLNDQLNTHKHNNKRVKLNNNSNGSQFSHSLMMQNINNAGTNINDGFSSSLQTMPTTNQNLKLRSQSQAQSQSEIQRQQNQHQLEQMEQLNQLEQFNPIQQLEHIQHLENIPSLDNIDINRINAVGGTESVLTANNKTQTFEQSTVSKLIDMIQTLQYSVINIEKELKSQKYNVIKLEQKLARNINEQRGSGLEISYDILPWKPETDDNDGTDDDEIQLPLLSNVFIIFSLTSDQLDRYLDVYNLSKITDTSNISIDNNNIKEKDDTKQKKDPSDSKLQTNIKEDISDMNSNKENVFQLAKFIGCQDVEKYWEVFSCNR